jgi:hypothetical protein
MRCLLLLLLSTRLVLFALISLLRGGIRDIVLLYLLLRAVSYAPSSAEDLYLQESGGVRSSTRNLHRTVRQLGVEKAWTLWREMDMSTVTPERDRESGLGKPGSAKTEERTELSVPPTATSSRSFENAVTFCSQPEVSHIKIRSSPPTANLILLSVC